MTVHRMNSTIDQCRIRLVKARIYDQLRAVLEALPPPQGAIEVDYLSARRQVLSEIAGSARRNQDKGVARPDGC